MIDRMLLFGATGDLAGRLLLPGLAYLHASGKLPKDFAVVGSARDEMTDEAFQQAIRERLDEHAADVPIESRQALVRSLRYRQADITRPDHMAAVVRNATDDGAAPIVAYLALPQGLFPTAITALGGLELPASSRIVVEKPFGEDLESAQELNALLKEVSGDAGADAMFRVDHVLGMATVQNLLGLRFANHLFESVWNSTHIEQIELLWEETLALEGRAGFYDKAGALKDVMQNHLMQVLCYVTMEQPTSFEEQDLRDNKVELLRAVQTLAPDEMASRTRRARYTAGKVGDRVLPAYADEEGVDPDRGTETYAEVMLEIDNDRWQGTRFVLRAGKALAERRKEAIVTFRPVPHQPFGDGHLPTNELRIGVDGPMETILDVTGSEAGPPLQPVPVTFTLPPPPSDLTPYSRVLLDVLNGGSALSVRGDEAEESWRIMDPVLQAWADDLVPLEEYAAGSVSLPPRGTTKPQ